LVVLLLPACSDDADDVAATTTVPTTTVIETTTTAGTTPTTSTPPTTTQPPLNTTTEASEDGPAGLSVDELPPSMAAFKVAYESGDLEAIQAVFADDGIMTTTANVHELYYGADYHLGTWDKNGREFRRMASIHHGEMIITESIEIGQRAVAFDCEWEDFASGTAILHLRGDQIVVAVLAVTEVEIPKRRS
jgi:hypothetical protein